MKHTASLVRLLIVTLLLLWGGTACGGEEAAPTAAAVAQVVETPTETAVPPTDTPAPTNTPEPTETPAPTDTATPTETPVPTDTPEPTETPTAVPTDTPAPTKTAVPATNTPAAASAATATPTEESGDEEAEDDGEPEMITVYYISNPNDILGVFPELPFDAAGLTANMNNIHSSLQTMRGSIDGAKAGDAAACSTYVSAYNNILYSGVFYKDVPGDWEEIDFVYFLSFIYSLDRTRPAYLSCVNAGSVDDFNYGLAVQTIDQTLTFLTPSLNAANSR
ncbi:MAG: hypothetical protein IPM53_13420 [Anaerolineaceae bacterium]|nr:hypothetical protein [Anaerolineaceae bacterium]